MIHYSTCNPVEPLDPHLRKCCLSNYFSCWSLQVPSKVHDSKIRFDICYFSLTHIIYQKKKFHIPSVQIHYNIHFSPYFLVCSSLICSSKFPTTEVKLFNLSFPGYPPPLSPPFFLGKEHLMPFPHPPECPPLTKYISNKIPPHN